MTSKNEAPGKGDKNIAKALLMASMKVLATHFAHESYLSKKPNNNSPTEEAIAIIIMATSGLVASFKQAHDNGNIQVMAMSLRAIIECHANISYILNNNSDKLSVLYVQTLETAAEQFYALGSTETPKTKLTTPRWTNTSISHRVKNIDNGYYHRLWSFLSSYVHVDAGHLSMYVYGYKDALTLYMSGLTALNMYGIFDLLEKHKIIKHKDTIHWTSALKVELDKLK